MDGLLAGVGLALLLSIFLPLAVYALNLHSVPVPKRVILESGLIATILVASGLAILSLIPRIGAAVALGVRFLVFAVFLLVLFPNRTGEITGFEDHLAGPGNFIPLLKLTALLGVGVVWHYLRNSQFRALLLSIVATIFLGSIAIAIFAHSKVDEAAALDTESVAQLLTLGKRNNVIVIAFDGFTGYRMAEILEQRPELRNAFVGFTLYPRAIASALNTIAGSSVLLTGDLRIAIETEDLSDRNARSLESSFLVDAVRAGHNAAYLSSLTVPSTSIPSANEQVFYSRGVLPFSARALQYVSFQAIALSRVFPELFLKPVRRAV
jgi:hypothetical protein